MRNPTDYQRSANHLFNIYDHNHCPPWNPKSVYELADLARRHRVTSIVASEGELKLGKTD